MNVVGIVGNIGQPPEIRYFQSGSVVAKFSVAVRRQRKAREGEQEQDWFPVEVWGKTAEFVANYCTAGSSVAVSGSMEFESYKDRETGKNRSYARLKADSVQLLRKRKLDGSGWEEPRHQGEEQAEERPPAKFRTSEPAPATAAADNPSADPDYSDIPF